MFAALVAVSAASPAAAQYPCDINGDAVVDAGDLALLEHQMTFTYLFTGSGTGNPCDWAYVAECQGPPMLTIASANVTFPLNMSAIDMAALFAVSVNAASPAPIALRAIARPSLPIVDLTVGLASPTDLAWLDLVDTVTLASCSVVSGVICACNPTIQLVEIAAPCNPSCIADVNGSGAVDARDIGVLLASWGTAEPCVDLDGSGIVDAADLGAILASWGVCP